MATREQIVSNLMSESERLQYDEGDPQRIYEASDRVTKSFVSLLGLAAAFRSESQSEADEDSAGRMAQIRMDLVEAYALALVDLYKFGSTFRISDEAFDRMVSFLSGPEDKPLIMAGL
jgi:hypothetical protein